MGILHYIDKQFYAMTELHHGWKDPWVKRVTSVGAGKAPQKDDTSFSKERQARPSLPTKLILSRSVYYQFRHEVDMNDVRFDFIRETYRGIPFEVSDDGITGGWDLICT